MVANAGPGPPSQVASTKNGAAGSKMINTMQTCDSKDNISQQNSSNPKIKQNTLIFSSPDRAGFANDQNRDYGAVTSTNATKQLGSTRHLAHAGGLSSTRNQQDGGTSRTRRF